MAVPARVKWGVPTSSTSKSKVQPSTTVSTRCLGRQFLRLERPKICQMEFGGWWNRSNRLLVSWNRLFKQSVHGTARFTYVDPFSTTSSDQPKGTPTENIPMGRALRKAHEVGCCARTKSGETGTIEIRNAYLAFEHRIN